MKAELFIPQKTIDEMNEMLLQKSRIDGYGELIETFTACFPGGSYEVDIKVVNGDEQSGPYVDAVLFEDGNELAVLEPGDNICGEYWFWLRGESYEVIISPANENL